jgi:hypothetical protein
MRTHIQTGNTKTDAGHTDIKWDTHTYSRYTDRQGTHIQTWRHTDRQGIHIQIGGHTDRYTFSDIYIYIYIYIYAFVFVFMTWHISIKFVRTYSAYNDYPSFNQYVSMFNGTMIHSYSYAIVPLYN